MKFCFECGMPSDIDHHVIPRSKGGTKTVPLCNKCHSLVHDAKLVSLPELQRLGKEKVRQNKKNIVDMFENKQQISKIAKKINISRTAVYNTLEKQGLHKNEGKGCEIKVTPDYLDKIKDMRHEGASWEEIEEKLDICHTHLFRIIKEFGWSDKKYNSKTRNRTEYRTLTQEKIGQIDGLRKQNKTWDEIAAILGVDRTTLNKHGITKQYKSIAPTKLKGKLTDDKKQLALILKSKGKTWKEIANLLDISISAIYMSKLNKLI